MEKDKLLKDCTNEELLQYLVDYENDFIKYHQGKEHASNHNIDDIAHELSGIIFDTRVLFGICKEIVKRTLVTSPKVRKQPQIAP